MLAEKGIVSASGRSDEPGRPLYYTTTGQFLELFALRDLSDLPTLRDLRELKQDDPREQLQDDEAGEPHESLVQSATELLGDTPEPPIVDEAPPPEPLDA
jgi:segregation and condensation protein B